MGPRNASKVHRKSARERKTGREMEHARLSARDEIFDAFKTRSGTLLCIKNLTLERTLSAALTDCK